MSYINDPRNENKTELQQIEYANEHFAAFMEMYYRFDYLLDCSSLEVNNSNVKAFFGHDPKNGYNVDSEGNATPVVDGKEITALAVKFEDADAVELLLEGLFNARPKVLMSASA